MKYTTPHTTLQFRAAWDRAEERAIVDGIDGSQYRNAFAAWSRNTTVDPDEFIHAWVASELLDIAELTDNRSSFRKCVDRIDWAIYQFTSRLRLF